MITTGNEVGLSKISETRCLFNDVLVKITNLHSRENNESL
jgi:hypothetical protein